MIVDSVKVEAVDLFCGAGGLSYGLAKAGVQIKAGLDFEDACDYPFRENVGADFLCKDLAHTEASELEVYYSPDAIKLLAGCAPCQPFSTLSNGSNRQTSKKWPLLNEFRRMVAAIRPELVTMENVPVLRTQSIFNEFVQSLKDLGFYISFRTVDAADYGVPQRRKRLVLLASTLGPIRLLSPEELGVEKSTVRQAIGNLTPIKAGEADANDNLHKARTLTPINLERMKASRPGGTWQDWPEGLRLACHKRDAGSTFKSVYGRMEWDKPSSTMTTQSYNFGTGRYGHPEQDRSLSLREMAILQSFPRDYRFVSPENVVEFANIGRLIGNAVPVDLGYAIGVSLKEHCRHFRGGEECQTSTILPSRSTSTS